MKITIHTRMPGAIERLIAAGFTDFHIQAEPPAPMLRDERDDDKTAVEIVKNFLFQVGPATFAEVKNRLKETRFAPNGAGAILSKLARKGEVVRLEGRKWALCEEVQA